MPSKASSPVVGHGDVKGARGRIDDSMTQSNWTNHVGYSLRVFLGYVFRQYELLIKRADKSELHHGPQLDRRREYTVILGTLYDTWLRMGTNKYALSRAHLSLNFLYRNLYIHGLSCSAALRCSSSLCVIRIIFIEFLWYSLLKSMYHFRLYSTNVKILWIVSRYRKFEMSQFWHTHESLLSTTIPASHEHVDFLTIFPLEFRPGQRMKSYLLPSFHLIPYNYTFNHNSEAAIIYIFRHPSHGSNTKWERLPSKITRQI